MAQMISNHSRSICKLTLLRVYKDGAEHTSRSYATGFFWRHRDSEYLVTNWHNLTGLRADNLENNGTFYPNKLRVEFKIIEETEVPSRVRIIGRERTQIIIDENGRAGWMEHQSQNAVDLACIRVPTEWSGSGKIRCLNDGDFETRWTPEIGSDCFVLGYPEGMEGQHQTPIWKRASIATEAQLNFEGQPVLLVDTLGRHGMSGAPVIARSSGVFSPGGTVKPTLDTVVGTWENFVGVYGGRIGERDIGFQLGRVWKYSALKEILENPLEGHHPKYP